MWKKGQALVPDLDRVRRRRPARAALRRPRRLRPSPPRWRTTSTTSPPAASRRTQWLHPLLLRRRQRRYRRALKRLVEENLDADRRRRDQHVPVGLDPDGEEIVVKPGQYGPYVKRGDDTAQRPRGPGARRAHRRQGARAARGAEGRRADRRADGFPVYAKNGRYGPYVQWGDRRRPPPGRQAEDGVLFKTMTLERITLDDAVRAAVAAADGRRRPGRRRGDHRQQRPLRARTSQKGKDNRILDNEEQLLTVTLDEASEIFAQPKCSRGGGRTWRPPAAARARRRPGERAAVVAKDGRFGAYVTDGETNASLGKGDRIETMAPERAFELLADPPRAGRRRRAAPPPRRRPRRRRPPRRQRPRRRRPPRRPSAARKQV